MLAVFVSSAQFRLRQDGAAFQLSSMSQPTSGSSSSKRSATEISGGTSESVAQTLSSADNTAVTDAQLDLLLPTEGFEVLAKPPPTEQAAEQEPQRDPSS